MFNNDGSYRWVPNNGGGSPKSFRDFPWKKVKTAAIVLAVVLFVAIGVFTCYYTVDDKQQAVVTTFGKVTDVVDPGLHFKLPFGIQQVEPVDVNVYQKIELGYNSTAPQ